MAELTEIFYILLVSTSFGFASLIVRYLYKTRCCGMYLQVEDRSRNESTSTFTATNPRVPPA